MATPPILPIAQRLSADARLGGHGITIAFLDSGFFDHPDLTQPKNRILVHHDIVTGETLRGRTPPPDVSSWHGMMTSVVCAGNGRLSGGVYKGLAHDAEVVLVKVGSVSRIRHLDIAAGIRWVIARRAELGIRILNISCGGDYEASYLTDELSHAAEDATRAGIVVIAAVGNMGNDPGHRILPPASAPSVIAVGGIDDNKDSQPGRVGLYHSSFGPTYDGLQKPEVLAPAIWLAAPILPETPTAAQAGLVDALAQAKTLDDLRRILDERRGTDAELDQARDRDEYFIRNLVQIKRKDQKLVSEHYKHVDGTSFAAPIVSSVIAQMLEANPQLTPMQVKRILIQTAKRLPDVSVERQGWGVVQPASAVARALEKRV